jgi:hypothetical protein
MNYEKHYNILINRAKGRILDSYTETHHIIPEHFFINRIRKGPKGWLEGDPNAKENLVELTPEEHLVAHQLLVKIYPRNHGLIYAAFMMGTSRQTNKVYGWLRRRHAEFISEFLSDRPKSEEHKQKLSKIQKGRASPKIGCKLSKETKDKISKSRTGHGHNHSEETKLKIGSANRGKPRSEESNIRRSIALSGRSLSEETKKKMSVARKGKKRNQ